MLAIAGLIFLMVFIALPALQRSQRDTQRRDDMSRFMSAIQSYQSNNNGNLPTLTTQAGSTAFLNNYLKQDVGEFVDPDGTNYSINTNIDPGNQVAAGNIDHNIFFVSGARCGEDGNTIENDGARNYAILYRLEGAGVYCGDNN